MYSLSRLTLGALIVLFTSSARVTAEPEVNYEPYTFSRIAGNGPGSDDGLGPDARFYDPEGVTTDAHGNVYVADYKNHTIRKITPGGMVTTLAGSAGLSDDVDGTGSAARFRSPTGVAADSSGNLYVTSGSGVIRRITPAGVVTTLLDSAGNPVRAADPGGLAVDAAGNVYVAASFSHTIIKVSPAGVVTTLAGADGSAGYADGSGSNARFAFPNDVVVDAAGTVYVADTYNHAIRKITPHGVVSTFAGLGHTPGSNTSGSNDGTGTAARFFRPRGVDIDGSGTLFVADTGNHTIRRITPHAVVTTIAGSAGSYGTADGTGSSARFAFPAGVAVDRAGNLYVPDADSNTIRRIKPDRAVVTLAGLPGGSGSNDGVGAAARFAQPYGVAVDKTRNTYVADTYNHTIRRINPDGAVSTIAGLPGARGNADGLAGAARFNTPSGIAVDGNGIVYVADTYNNVIRSVRPDGLVTTIAGSGRSGNVNGTGTAAQFAQPRALAVDSSRNIYVAESDSRIRKIDPAGVVTTFAGGGYNNPAGLFDPAGLAVDGSGNVYVADRGTNIISKITPAGAVTRVAGSASAYEHRDGPADVATFNRPSAIAVTSGGNIFVVEEAGHTLRRISPAGVVTTLGGIPGRGGHANGTGPAARLNYPQGIAPAADGRLVIADSHNDTIRVAYPAPPNVAPAAADQSLSTKQDTAKAIRLTASDANSDSLTFTVVTGPKHGTLSGTAPNLTYTPAVKYSGPDSFTFKVNDGQADSNTATVFITILSHFEAWRRGNFTVAELSNANISGPLADPNRNGLCNLMEYAFKAPPKISTTAKRPYVDRDGTYVSLIYTKNLEAADLTYTIEQVVDLAATWNKVPNVTEELMPNPPAGTQIIKAKVPHNGAATMFLRLRVSLP